jgi:toxin ParE1/3/4
MRLVLRRAAKRDLAEAARWYDERKPGLGREFSSCVEATLVIIRNHPHLSPRVDPRVRRAKVERFPYGVFYTVDREAIRVIAVLHHARATGTWKARLGPLDE